MKRYIIILLVLVSSIAAAQSYHTITIDGNNDFNPSNEKFNTTSGTTILGYVTWDKEYLYVGLSGSTPAGSMTDPTRAFHFYIDTDPQQNPLLGSGSSAGDAWLWNPTLPFTANYHYVFKTEGNIEVKKTFDGSLWQNTDFYTQNWKGSGYWEARIKIRDIGSPKQINLLVYVEEDWVGGTICGGIPENLFTNTTTQGAITFNNSYLNFYLIDQMLPNAAYHLNNYSWFIRLKAETNTLTDTSAYAGMAENGTNGFDSGYDIPLAPNSPSNYLHVYFPHPDWESLLGPNYSRDIKKLVSLDSTTSIWDFTVNTDITNSDVTISGENYDFIPSNYEIKIKDIAANVVHNLKSGSYQYNTGSPAAPRLFQLIIGVSLAPPNIIANKDTLKFGTIKTNSDSTISVTITNTGDSTLVISDITTTNTFFTFTGGTTHSIKKDSSVTIPVKFTPRAAGIFNEKMQITSNDPDLGLLDIILTGTGELLTPTISASPASLNFGNVRVSYDSTLTLKLYNTGDTTLNVSSIFTTSSIFTVSNTGGFTIAVGDSSSFNVTFYPVSVDGYNETLKIVNSDPEADTLSIQLTGSGIESTTEKEFSAGWNLMSIPLIPENPLASSIIGDDIAQYFLYKYSGNSYLPADTMSTGKGYWLGIETLTTIDITGSAIAQNDTSVLNAGWNLIASPFIRNYQKSLIYFVKNDTLANPESAVTLGWIQNNYYAYEKTGSAYISKDTLSTWNGYWFAALVDDLKMIFWYDSTTGNPPTEKPEEELINTENWFVTITAEMNGKRDDLLQFGVNSDATDDFDSKFDNAKPPISPVSGAIESYFEYSNWSPYFSKYLSDIKASFASPQPGKSWIFKVRPTTNGVIKLNWANIIQQLPDEIKTEYSFFLTGTGISSQINMLNLFEHQFEGTGNEVYTFVINSTLTNISDELNSYSFMLNQNYPNPFNPSTRISYSLPSSSYVTLKVFDILGNEVALLINTIKEAGNHEVTFNAGNLSNGVYFYELKAGGMRSVKKLILLK